MSVVRIFLTTSPRHLRVLVGLAVGRVPEVFLELLGVFAVLVGGTWTADALRVGMLIRHD